MPSAYFATSCGVKYSWTALILKAIKLAIQSMTAASRFNCVLFSLLILNGFLNSIELLGLCLFINSVFYGMLVAEIYPAIDPDTSVTAHSIAGLIGQVITSYNVGRLSPPITLHICRAYSPTIIPLVNVSI